MVISLLVFIGVLRYALRSGEVLSPGSLLYLGSNPAFASQGAGEAEAGHLLALRSGVMHSFLGGASTATSTAVKPQPPDEVKSRVNFKQDTPAPREVSSSSNQNSSSDSGIDNHVPATGVATGAASSTNAFSTLPSIARSGVAHQSFSDGSRRATEPTYFNQDQVSSSVSSTPILFDCPTMPPLSLPQNETGEVSFASLSRRFNLRAISFQPPSPPAPSAEVNALEDQLMSRSTIIRQDETPRQNAGRLCSQV